MLAHFYQLKLLSSLDIYCTVLCKCNWDTSNMRFTMWAQSASALAAWPAGLGFLSHRKRRVPTLHYCQNTCWVLAPHSKWTSTKWHTSCSQPGKQSPCPKHDPKGQSIHSLLAFVAVFTERNWWAIAVVLIILNAIWSHYKPHSLQKFPAQFKSTLLIAGYICPTAF